MSVQSELSRLAPRGRVVFSSEGLRYYASDFAGHACGRALAAVRPVSIEEVAALVRWARRRRIPLVPAGSLTSFWGNMNAGGAVIVDMRGMSRLVAFDEAERTVTVEAGMSVAALDRALRAKGFCLPVSPTGFGAATVASMVANDTNAGHGMFSGDVAPHLVGLTAVLGTGEVLRTGGSALPPELPRFSRAGLPDLAGLFLASEGALGIITELVLRVPPAPRVRAFELRVPRDVESFERVVAAAQAVRGGMLCHSWIHESSTTSQPDVSHIQIAGYGSGEELEAKRLYLAQALRANGLPPARALREPPSMWFYPKAQPRGEEGPRQATRWKGVAFDLPYARAVRAYSLWQQRLRRDVARLALPKGGLQTYFGREAVLALPWWLHSTEAGEERARELETRFREVLGPLGVPYRLGTDVGSRFAERLDPSYREALGAVKRWFDPDGVLNPGVGVFAAAARKGRSAGKRIPRSGAAKAAARQCRSARPPKAGVAVRGAVARQGRSARPPKAGVAVRGAASRRRR
ncbi:MAG: FAD-binding oxidoreductase [Elusimicrobiota bacterium]